MYQLSKVDKKFPGVHALKFVDFHVGRGEIVGLVGENGAGKSTLMKVIYGAYQPDSGQILIDGKSVRFANPRAAMAQGNGMVLQDQSLIANRTVMEEYLPRLRTAVRPLWRNQLESHGRRRPQATRQGQAGD